MLILIVCSGNTCRSPFAEALLAQQLSRIPSLGSHRVASAGTAAVAGAPASSGSLRVGREHGLDLSHHHARPLTRAMVTQADLILTMTPTHVQQVAALGGAAKVDTLLQYAGGASTEGVIDPFGGPIEAYRAMASEVAAAVTAIVSRLQGETPG